MGRRDRREPDDDDLGFRTPARRSEGADRSETAKRKRETGKHSSREPGPAASPEARSKPTTTAPAAPAEASGGRRASSAPKSPPPARREAGASPRALARAGVVVAVLIGCGLVKLLSSSDAPAPAGPIATTPIVDAPTPPEPPSRAEPTPSRPVSAPATPQPAARIERPAEEPKEEPAAKLSRADTLEELAARSSTHAAVARLLEAYNELFDPAALRNPGPMFEEFNERVRREEEMLAEARAMGPAAVEALAEMLLGLAGHRQYQVFLSKALAGIDGPQALEAVGELLGALKDVAIQTTLVRYLPETRDAAEAVGQAVGQEQDPTLRTMLLREYHRRLGDDISAGSDVFRNAALEDPDPSVRAVAVTILGRRADPTDQALMERIIADEPNLQIRQAAIVSYAETGRESSLHFLEGLARNPSTTLAIRASAVLGMARVGGDRAIAALDQIAQTDSHDEIRTRATRLAASLRRRAEEALGPDTRVDEDPLRVAPPRPIERR